MEKHTFTILGAGIAGLSTAIALRRLGIEAEIYEAAHHLEPVGAGIGIAANGVNALRRLGVEDELLPYSYPLSFLAIYDPHGMPILRIGTEQQEARHGSAQLAVHRAHLQMCLLARLDPARVRVNKRAVEASPSHDGYTLRFDDGSSIRTRYLIVADGIHSVVRQTWWPGSVPRYAGYQCWRGIANMEGLGIHEASEIWGPAGRVGMVPMTENRLYWFACINGRQDDPALRGFTRDDLLRHFRGYTRLFNEILHRTPGERIIRSEIMDIHPLDHFAKGNMLLVGDAAHAMTPNLGQGACQALEDAIVLGECLSENSNVAQAFRAFEQRRLERTRRIMVHSRRLGAWAQLSSPVLCRMRDTLFRWLPHSVHQRQLDWIHAPGFRSPMPKAVPDNAAACLE